MRRPRIASLVASIAPFALAACTKSQPVAPPAEQAVPAAPAAPPAFELPATALVFFKALPARFDSDKNPISEAKVSLGRQLYYDARLSKNQDVSCNSCHDLASFGVDGKPTSSGHRGQLGDRNSPTVYNAAGNFVQFWDGRAEDVESQAKGPVLNPKEMAMPSDKAVVAVLASIPGYVEAFKAAFPGDKDPVTYDNMARAIGAFERQLATPSRFDRFLAGDKKALTLDEQKGLAKFVETGCQACHLGANVGGGMYQKAGLVVPWPSDKDVGRMQVTRAEADKFVFRVPTLRNVAKTAPYFHDGSTADLKTAIKVMARHQLGKDVSDADAGSIETFLASLTGEVPAAYIAKPTLPPSGPKTPRPDPR